MLSCIVSREVTCRAKYVFDVCLFALQTGDFLTVDRCKVQGTRYQDESKADTPVGVGIFQTSVAG